MCGRYRAHAVGHTRTGREHGDTDLTRQLSVGFRREGRRLFVPDVNDAYVASSHIRRRSGRCGRRTACR